MEAGKLKSDLSVISRVNKLSRSASVKNIIATATSATKIFFEGQRLFLCYMLRNEY